MYSIIGNGLLYLHNETGVLNAAAYDAFGLINADDQSNGMICFTELSISESKSHQYSFGNFGIGISKEWLLLQDVKKVEYVEIGGDKYDALVSRLITLAPKSIFGLSIQECLADPQRSFICSQQIMNSKSSRNLGASIEYAGLLEKLAWTQTSHDSSQREWRVRNPKPYTFIGSSTLKQRIELLLHCINNPNIQEEFDGLIKYTVDMKLEIACVGKSSLALRVPIDQIKEIFCPANLYGNIKEELSKVGLRHIPVSVNVF